MMTDQNSGQSDGGALDTTMANAGQMGQQAFKSAVEDAMGNPLSQKATVENPSDVREMGNPHAGEALAGSALESNDDVISRLTGGLGTSDEGAGVAGQQPAPGQGLDPNAGQAITHTSEAQAEIDRLKQQNNSLANDALLGKYVRKDPLLMRSVGDSMQGRIPSVEVGMGQRPQQVSIEQQIGLPEHFVPIPEEFNAQGTDSYKWFRASMKESYQEDLQQGLSEQRQQDVLNQQAIQARAEFMAAEHTEEELEDLFRWFGDPENFTLLKLWDYKNSDARVVQAAGARPGPARPESVKQYTPSVVGVAGGGMPHQLPEETRIQVGMLELAQKNKNPLV